MSQVKLSRTLADRAWKYALPFVVVGAVAAACALAGLRVDEDDESLGADASHPVGMEVRARSDYARAILERPRVAIMIRAKGGDRPAERIASLVPRLTALFAAHPSVVQPRCVDGSPLESSAAGPRLSAAGTEALFRVELARPVGGSAKQSFDALVSAVKAVCRVEAGVDVDAAGVPVVDAAAVDSINRDQRTVIPLVVGAMALLLALFLRHWQGVVAPLGLSGLTILLTLGLYAACGERLNVLTSLLTPTGLVMSLCVAIHLLHANAHSREPGVSDREAVLTALRRTFVPSFLTTVTTAIGLLTLGASSIPAVRSFGWFAAFAVGVSWCLGVIFIPPFLMRWPLRGTRAAHGFDFGRTVPVRPFARVMVGTIVGFGVAVGATGLIVDTDFVGTLREGHAVRRQLAAIDRVFPGTLSLDALVDVAGSSQELLETLRASIAAVPDVEGVDLIPAAAVAADVAAPPGEWMWLRVGVGHLTSRGGARLEQRIGRILEDQLDPTAPSAGKRWQFAGMFNRIIRDSDQLARSQIRSLALAVITIVATIWIVFRSVRLTVLAFIANVSPIALLFGVMGWAGISLSVATSMTACVSLGIAVDDTLHILCGYRAHRRAGVAAHAAMRATLRATGGALWLTTLTLIVGFSVCATGSFVPTTMFSLLLAMTLAIAWLSDVLFLPAAAVWLEGRGAARAPVRANDLGLYDRHAQDWWDVDSAAFRSLHSVNALRVERLVASLANHGQTLRGALVVDLGCGGGIVAARLASVGGRVVGIDRSFASLRSARSGCRAAMFVNGDVTRASIRDGAADLVLLCDVVEHLDDYALALHEAARMVKPGGFVYVGTLNRTLRSRLLAVVAAEGIGLVPKGTHDARLFVRPSELAAEATAVGLRPSQTFGEGVRLWSTLRRRRVVPRPSKSLAIAYQALFQKPVEIR